MIGGGVGEMLEMWYIWRATTTHAWRYGAFGHMDCVYSHMWRCPADRQLYTGWLKIDGVDTSRMKEHSLRTNSHSCPQEGHSFRLCHVSITDNEG